MRYLLFLFLSLIVNSAFADYPATGQGWVVAGDYSQRFGSANAACASSAAWSGFPSTYAPSETDGVYCHYNRSDGVAVATPYQARVVVPGVCDHGGALNGVICVEDTCPDGSQKPAGGVCPCPPGQSWNQFAKRCDKACSGQQITSPDGQSCLCDVNSLNGGAGDRPWLEGAGSSTPDSICDGGCTRGLGFGLAGGGKWTAQGGAFTGATCSGTDKLPEKPPVPNKKPPCGASEGVMTSSSGTVACVPEGTADARKPDVSKSKKTETFPDASTKTTETETTTDPATGAKDVTTTTTSSGGQAGPAGTSNSNSSSSGATKSDGGDGCETNCTDKPGQFGEYGELWKKKYADGVAGVLNSKMTELKATPIFGLVDQLAPQGLPDSGACPSFNFSMNLGQGMNYGAGSISPPCYVFDAVRVILLITSLLLARRLIFGG